MKKKGIGYESYRDIIDDNCYFVDKTMLIEDVIRKEGKVTLLSRPRRFGKTLALSMLRTFFECGWELDGKKINAAHYYEGKKIMQAGPPVNPTNPAIILELKVRKKFNEMAEGIKEAIKQIKDMKYEEGILEEGYVGVKAYGICFCKKTAL